MSEIKSNKAWRLECEELRNTNQRQQAEIERLNARIKDYQDACIQKQEIINGYKELETAIRQDQIEKDASLFEGLYTDTCPGMNISNTIRKQLTKQVQGDV